MNVDSLYESLLEEGISNIVYHNTSLKNLLNILGTNKFILTSTEIEGLDSLFNAKKDFFLSTSRTRTGSYRKTNFPFAAFITLDGRKLAQRYSGVAVDYIGHKDRPRRHHHTAFEQEDRILSNVNTIDNALSYIIKIELFSKKGTKLTEQEQEFIYNATDRHRIPVYIYGDSQSFLTGNHRQTYRLLDPETESLF